MGTVYIDDCRLEQEEENSNFLNARIRANEAVIACNNLLLSLARELELEEEV